MTTTTFDQAQESSWALDFESPAEREERIVIEAGRVLDIMTDSDFVSDADEVAEDFARHCCPDYTTAALKMCGCWSY